MGLRPDFPRDPHAILDPEIRWYPGEELFTETGYATLIPPLVHKIRKGVNAWRNSGYSGASETTRALLRHWFIEEREGLRYYFAQREAVESAIWLYEVEGSRDPYALMKYDASGRVSKGMFQEDWTRYVMKCATGVGKTKIMSLLLAWSYFHKTYEQGSDLSANFLMIAPNIIVLDRLRLDFGDLKIFYSDPLLPENGYAGQNWRDDFQITLHVQDEIGPISTSGNLFLSNIQRVYQTGSEPSFEDEDTTNYFLGPKPSGKTTDSKLDLGEIVRDIPDLVIFNDEAHHIHDESLAWFQNIADISSRLRLKGSRLSAQFDLTATPKHTNGAIFVQTISDYPLVEAIRQGIVKTPVLPDEASRAKLSEKQSDKFTERYGDYLHLGYLEWLKVYEQLLPTGKKSVLFVMTDDTRNCDEVGEYLAGRYPELRDAVLVIHTKQNGEISEASGSKSRDELERLRELSRKIDDPETPYRAIVSVIMLREGWDVQNVVAMVGLRPYKSASKILPEQTLGRGLRRMFRGEPIVEKVSVVGTDAFMDFVESIKTEGVDLDHAPMGPRTPAKAPLVVEVDLANSSKDIPSLDIEIPVLSPRIFRNYKNLSSIDVERLPKPALPLKIFSAEEQREIVFKDIDSEGVSHTTVLDSEFASTSQSAVGFFARALMRDLRLVGGFDVLFGKLKSFLEEKLFDHRVDLDDLNVLRNLSEPAATRGVFETFRAAINNLTVEDRGTSEVRDSIKLSKARPFIVDDQGYLVSNRSIFNKVVTDNRFELEVAEALSGCPDIISFAKLPKSVGYRIEYRNAEGSIANYYPDFVVKETADRIWVIETKGREDLDDPPKWKRLQEWCRDATKLTTGTSWGALFIRQEDWERYRPKSFSSIREAFDQKPLKSGSAG